MEKQPLLGFRRGIHNSGNPGREHALVRGGQDADVTGIDHIFFFLIDIAILFSFLVLEDL